MAPDADGCAEVDPVVEPLCGIGALQRQANATVRGGMSRDLPESVNKNILVPLDELQRAGATITWSDDGMQSLVASDHGKIAIQFPNKRVEVDLANQRLRAYQGTRLVLDSRISTGREGKKTPPGEFKAGPVKSPMHRSRLYRNATMPWSVQVHEIRSRW